MIIYISLERYKFNYHNRLYFVNNSLQQIQELNCSLKEFELARKEENRRKED